MVTTETVRLPSVLSQVVFQVPAHDGAGGVVATGVAVVGTVVAAGAGEVFVQPVAISRRQRMPARRST
ncbi:MAG: hypothetical protein A4E38_01543 [Methanoregulaceae archaeon PtaB.Bin108]|nr:MAG: hypothetical protein A4E38_01543 [Methanoregulaceae archaeon PtaB.Bin108]